jgi:hypothetical protein
VIPRSEKLLPRRRPDRKSKGPDDVIEALMFPSAPRSQQNVRVGESCRLRKMQLVNQFSPIVDPNIRHEAEGTVAAP